MERRIGLSLPTNGANLQSTMTNAHTSRAPHAQREAEIISIRQRAGIWRVARDGEFYGDYTRRYWAIEAAVEKADAIAADGGAAVITIAMDGEADATLYDTRQPAPREAKAAKSAFERPQARRWPSLLGERSRLLEQAKG